MSIPGGSFPSQGKPMRRLNKSNQHFQKALATLPLGVSSNFRYWGEDKTIYIKRGKGARIVDFDDNEYIDYDMGFGALFAGHMNPHVRRAVEEQLDSGTLYVTPCELNGEVGELLAERYGFPMWRPTNSGTEATMDAIRLARGVTCLLYTSDAADVYSV